LSTAKRITLVCIIGLAFLLLILGRVVTGTYKEFSRAEKYFSSKENVMASVHYERAIRWYTPLNPMVRKSIQRMLEIAAKYEEKGSIDDSINTYEALRGAIYSTRSFYTPYKNYIKLADESIARLRVLSAGSIANPENMGNKPTREDILAVLSKDRAPNVFWSIFMIGSFFGWVITVILFTMKIMPKEKLPGKSAVLSGALFFIFYIAWLLGMAKA
jgi:hypothetical protein